MRIETLLNNCSKFKSHIFKRIRFESDELIVEVCPRKNGIVHCSECGAQCICYDHLPNVRRFQFVPLCGHQVYFEYRMRRVSC